MKRMVLVILVAIMIGGCNGSFGHKKFPTPLMYDFKEPTRFPFEVDEASTEIAVDNPESLHQFIFHYKNKQTTQEIKYIVSKVINRPETLAEEGKKRIELENGVQAYFKESDSTQSIWWESDNGFLARFVYHIKNL